VVFFLLVSLPTVQTGLARQLTREINQNYQTAIKVDGVSIDFSGAVMLESFFIADHHSDTLFFANTFKTDLYSLGQWLNGNLFFSTTTLQDFQLKIIQYEGEEHNSFFQFTDKLIASSDPQETESAFVRIDNLNISNGSLRVIDLNDEKPPLEFEAVQLKAKDFFVVNKGVEAVLQNLTFTSNKWGEYQVSDTNLYYDPCLIEINSLHMAGLESHFNGELTIHLPDNPAESFVDHAFFDLYLTGVFSQQLLKKFLSHPPTLPPTALDFFAKGTPNDFFLSELSMKNDETTLEADLSVREWFSAPLPKTQLKIGHLKFPPTSISQWIPTKTAEQLPQSLFKYDTFVGFGRIDLQNNVLTSSLTLDSSAGQVNHHSRLNFEATKGSMRPKNFDGEVRLKNFDLSKWSPGFRKIDALVSLASNDLAKADFNFKVDVDLLEYKTQKLRNINIDGALQQKVFSANLMIDNAIAKATAILSFDQSELQRKYQLDLTVDALNLHRINPLLGGGRAVYAGGLNLFLVGNSVDDLKGNLLFKNLRFESQSKTDKFNDFILETVVYEDHRTIRTINSDVLDVKMEGAFYLSELPLLFSNAIAEAYPFFPKQTARAFQELVFDMSVQTEHLNSVFPFLSADQNAIFRGVLSNKQNVSKMTLKIPSLKYRGVAAQEIEFQLDNQNPFFNTFLSTAHVQIGGYEISEFNTLGIKSGDRLDFRTVFHGGDDRQDVYQLNYSVWVENLISKILLKSSTAKVREEVWTFNPQSEEKQFLTFDTNSNKVVLNHLEMQSSEGKIQATGNYTSLDDFSLQLNMDRIALESLFLSGEDFSLAGDLDLDLKVQRSTTNNALDFNGGVSDLRLNDLDMGDLRFFTSGNTQLNSYEINADLNLTGRKTMRVKGNILGFDQTPKLDIDLQFDRFDLSFLTAVGGGDIDNIRGNVSGEVNLWGSFDSPKHNGSLLLNNGGLAVPDINTDYQIADSTRVSLIEQRFVFSPTTFHDTYQNTKGALSGKIEHQNFSNWSFDISVESERILMLNIPEEEDEVFFGDGYLGGAIHLYGPSKNLTMDVVGATETGTSIKIPWADDYGLADTSFINFVDKNNPTDKQNQSQSDFASMSGLEMNFELDVNTKAEIGVVIDKESGSYLSGRGAGNLLMEIDTNGKFNMWGDFITYEGVYNFKNLGVIDKKFNLKQGGTIVWEGDPLGAQMDLEAVYEVPGGANPALLLDNPNFNRKIPTEVLIRLQGNLLKPDDPVFEIDFPNTNTVVTSEINYRLSDPQISQLQAISLLSQGIFISEVSVSVQGITNNLYEKASDLFSNLLGNGDGKLQVGLNYLQGDRSNLVDVNTEDRLGLTLSTQITDKILLNGKIGVPVGGIEETLIVGNLQIDFILNDEGSLKAKVFNKENEFRYLGDELGYTQGVGLSYQVDFETFRDLLTKIVKGEVGTPSYVNTPQIPEDNNSAVNFINKK